MEETKTKKKTLTNGLIFAITLFILVSYTLLSLRNGSIDYIAMLFSLACVALVLVQYLLFRFVFVHADLQVMIIVSMLTNIGLALQYRFDSQTAVKQLIWYGISLVIMILIMIIMPRMRNLKRFGFVCGILGVLLLGITIVIGTEINGSTNWIVIKGFSIQPSEPAKILMILLLAGSLAKHQQIRRLFPTGIIIGIAMILLVLQKDLGATLLYFCTAVLMLYLGTGNFSVTALAFLLGAIGAVVSYMLFSHVRVRVFAWLNPWEDPLGRGYQLVQSLIAISSGGLFGMGLGMGEAATYLPQHESDFIFSSICEEYGQIIGLCVAAFYIVLIFRGCILALRSRGRFDSILCFGIVSILAIQTFINIGGVIKLIPLTGVTLPFVSYGGSSMLTSFALIGMLQALSIKAGEADEQNQS